MTSQPLPTGAATEATLLTIDADTSNISAKIDAIDTDTSNISAKIDTIDTDTSNISTKIDTVATDLTALNARLAGSLVPNTHDYVATTYVAAGNGVGEIETVVYKTGGAAGSTVATLTLAYDGSNRLSSVTRS
jgi:outer membrane murein-binding lipoprotein Lpp